MPVLGSMGLMDFENEKVRMMMMMMMLVVEVVVESPSLVGERVFQMMLQEVLLEALRLRLQQI